MRLLRKSLEDCVAYVRIHARGVGAVDSVDGSELVVAARAGIEPVILTPLGHPLYTRIRRKEPR